MALPTLRELTDELLSIAESSEWLIAEWEPVDGEEEPYVDVRLRVHRSCGWEVLTGDPQYDTDHRGAWASAYLPIPCDEANARKIARDMLAELE